MIWGEWGLSQKEKTKRALEEKQPLPIGRAEFHTWSERIIQSAGISATSQSLKFALARMILDLKPTVAFESDAFFIHCLRKGCANQVADKLMVEIRDAEKLRLAEETKKAEATAPQGGCEVEHATV